MTISIPSGLAPQLDLERAWRRVWKDRSTDFVNPPIIYSAVNANRTALLDQLTGELESGEYRPAPARIIDVPKPNHTLRPGAILNVKDRVLYQALVDVIAETTIPRILGPPDVFGFQTNPDNDSAEFLLHGGFSEFRRRLSEEYDAGNRHVLESDIAAYFESVQTRFMLEALLGLDIDPRIAEVLIRLLGSWNSLTPIGLPQGVWPSDYLGGRIYLDRVDKGMLQKEHRFFRYSDDMRIAASRRLDVRRGLRDLV
ncbi:MAG: hypothetical protein E6J42_11230, partial [Chloroflexi bacterium]